MEEKWLNKRFLLLLVLILVAFFMIMFLCANNSYIYATTTSEGAAQANATASEIQSIRETASATSIFFNNFEVSVFLSLPVIGLVLFGITLANTGAVVGFLSAIVGVSPATYFKAILPIALPETFAYSLLATEATYVVLLAVTRAGAKQRIGEHSWKTFLAYVLVLFITAVVEAWWIGTAG